MTRPFYQASPCLLLVPGADASVTLLYYLYLLVVSLPSPPYDPTLPGISKVSRRSVLSCLLSLFLSGCSTPQHPFSSQLPRSLGCMFIFALFLNGVLDDLGFSFFYLFV